MTTPVPNATPEQMRALADFNTRFYGPPRTPSGSPTIPGLPPGLGLPPVAPQIDPDFGRQQRPPGLPPGLGSPPGLPPGLGSPPGLPPAPGPGLDLIRQMRLSKQQRPRGLPPLTVDPVQDMEAYVRQQREIPRLGGRAGTPEFDTFMEQFTRPGGAPPGMPPGLPPGLPPGMPPGWGALPVGVPFAAGTPQFDTFMEKFTRPGGAPPGMPPGLPPVGAPIVPPGMSPGLPPQRITSGSMEKWLAPAPSPVQPAIGLGGAGVGANPGPAFPGLFRTPSLPSSPLGAGLQPAIGTPGGQMPSPQQQAMAPLPFPNQFTGLGQGNIPSGGLGTFGNAFSNTLQWPFGPR